MATSRSSHQVTQVAPITIGLILLLSLGGLSFALLQGWPLWAAGAATLLPWIPVFVLNVAHVYRVYQWLALFYVLVVTQTGHLLVYVAHMGHSNVHSMTG